MSRRPLVANLVTTAAGALLGAFFGALVGRLIGTFGDETVQASVPMVFCGTLGYFVGGGGGAKGSLDRFGATRSALGTAGATAILVVVVGGASLLRMPGLIVLLLGILSVALAAVVATLVGQPQEAPVPMRAPGAAPPPRAPRPPKPEREPKAAKEPKAPKQKRVKEPKAEKAAREPKPVKEPKQEREPRARLRKQEEEVADLSDLFEDGHTDELEMPGPRGAARKFEPAPG